MSSDLFNKDRSRAVSPVVGSPEAQRALYYDTWFKNPMFPAHPLLKRDTAMTPTVIITPTSLSTSLSLKDVEISESLAKILDLREDIEKDIMRQMVEAFAAGVEYVSLTVGGHEVSRIYADGRHHEPAYNPFRFDIT